MPNGYNGRTGMGLVMASKNMKAIVTRSKQKVQLANAAGLAAMNKTGAKSISENPDVDGLARHGTAGVVMFQNMIGTLPTRNYSEGQFEFAEAISGERMSETTPLAPITSLASTTPSMKRVLQSCTSTAWLR